MGELSKGTKGSLAELRVCCHLIGLGFQVFRNQSSNGPTDLVALRGRRTIRVQVKSTLGMNQFKNLRQGGNDLLAVLVDGEIRYRAVNRRIASMVPGCILARRPKRRI
jgi:Holliday junction resolvase